MRISEREGDTSTWCGTYPHFLDEARMNNHQASYFVSIHLIFVFILTLSVLRGEVRLQSNTDTQLKGCNTNEICVRVNP